MNYEYDIVLDRFYVLTQLGKYRNRLKELESEYASGRFQPNHIWIHLHIIILQLRPRLGTYLFSQKAKKLPF